MIRLAAIGVCVTALAGCAFTKPPVPATVPIAVSCVKVKPERPPLASDADLAQMNDAQFVLSLGRFYILAQSYIAELEAVVSGCTKAP